MKSLHYEFFCFFVDHADFSAGFRAFKFRKRPSKKRHFWGGVSVNFPLFHIQLFFKFLYGERNLKNHIA